MTAICNEDDETPQHFLVECKKYLEKAGQPILRDFLRVLKHPVSAEYTMIQLLVDSDIVTR